MPVIVFSGNNHTIRSTLASLLPPLLVLLLGTCVRAQTFVTPVNDIVSDRADIQAPPPLQTTLRAADISWQKRVWRTIDVKEKINHTFTYRERPLITILLEAADEQRIQLYSAIDDKFSTPLSEEDRLSINGKMDTVEYYNPDHLELSYRVVPREFDPATVVRYRLQEIHYFDRKTSRQEVRLLGIAPIVEEKDENGNFMFERPLFWVYYPGARPVLGTEYAFVDGNDAANRSWADVLDSRFFRGRVVQESNVRGERIQDYLPAGRQQLLEGDKIEGGLLNREQDNWSY